MKQLKIALAVSSSVLIGVLCYCLFQPIFLYPLDWEPLPIKKEIKRSAETPDSATGQIESLLRETFRTVNAPALSVAVGRNDSLVYSKAIGFSDIQRGIQATPRTQFRIGSTSKAVTSLGLGVLLEQQKLTLHQTVGSVVPYVNREYSGITVEQLASHTSGIRNYRSCFCFPIWENLNTKQFASIEESVSVFSASDLLFAPGTAYSYSTYNFTLLSAVIEGVSQMTFMDFMKTAVFNPLSITEINPDLQDITSENISLHYEVADNAYKEAFAVNNSNKWAGGGLIASPSGLVQLGNAAMNTSLLKKETTAQLFSPVALKNGMVNSESYGLGWRIGTTNKVFADKKEVKIIHHGGTAVGGTSVLILFPEYNISISLLMNKSGSVSELFEAAYKIVAIYVNDGN